MVSELMMLPMRLGARVTQLWLRAAEETVSIAASIGGRAIAVAASRDSKPAHDAERQVPRASPSSANAPASTDAGAAASTDRPRPSVAPAASAQTRTPARPQPTEGSRQVPSAAPAEQQAPQVSEEAHLIEEFAEPGVEEGAGADVHVDQPWDGYDQMSAKQVISRLGGASPAELAAVQLYESGHRRRQTVLNAVKRELQGVNGSGSQSQERGTTDA